jgi:molybdenum cofactor cytidylyltransferase
MPSERTAPLAGIILAAGESRRMGENKLLMKMAGDSVVRRAVRNAIEAGLSPVIVVLGFEAERVADELAHLDIQPVLNPDFHLGINTSVQLGISCVPDQCSGAMVILADMPLVTSRMMADVASRYRQGREPLVISLYDGVHAPPTLYDRSLFGEFDGPAGEGCGRRIVEAHRHEAATVAWPGDRLADLDVPEDVERVRVHLAEATS